MKRRHFLQYIPAGLVMVSNPLIGAQTADKKYNQLTILHTNDWHSRIEAFPMDGSRNQGLGGASKRAALIEQIRSEQENVLLLDSGDIFQGTPYFNFFEGELEFKLMSSMGYDAATIGNHDFDGGIDNLAHQLKDHASFKMLNANYDVKNTELRDLVRPYQVFNRGDLKIGVFGIGIELDGLVPEKLYGNIVFQDPIETANSIAEQLHSVENCDLIICLSHLGYKYNDQKVSDLVLASKSKNIDIILGGHTHTFMKEPEKVLNAINQEVLVHQVGWAGILLGRIDVKFEENKKSRICSGSRLKI
jgi:5'-nucleotidase